MRVYEITVERDGRFWLIHVPEIGQHTQAANLDHAGIMARDVIAAHTGAPVGEIGVRIVEKVEALLNEIDDFRDRLSVHERTGNTVSVESLIAELDPDTQDGLDHP